jgi:hypothetical protein
MMSGSNPKNKGRPHYPLHEVKRLIQEGKVLFSERIDLGQVGLVFEEAVSILLALKQTDFHASNEDYYAPGVWQDAYIKEYGDISLYIKFKVVNKILLIITSCKNNE